MIKNIIAWDLGATKCAVGLITYNTQDQQLVCQKTACVKLRDATSLEDLIEKLEASLSYPMQDSDAICIGGAGHYDGSELILEGIYPYPMKFAEVARKLHWPAFHVIHDYASVVCATFTAYMEQPGNIKYLNECAVDPHGRRVALGIGTGLGLKDGVLLPSGDFWLGKNEIGHIGIATPPKTDKYRLQRHHDLIHYLHDRMLLADNEPITFEKLLSGRGTVSLYQFFYPDETEITPEEVGSRMRSGQVPELQSMFAWYVGLLIGTVQLTFMPEGGVWVTGGVALKNLELFDNPDFFAGIYASPAYRAQREAYPLGVLCNLEHALMGSGFFAAKRLLS